MDKITNFSQEYPRILMKNIGRVKSFSKETKVISVMDYKRNNVYR